MKRGQSKVDKIKYWLMFRLICPVGHNDDYDERAEIICTEFINRFNEDKNKVVVKNYWMDIGDISIWIRNKYYGFASHIFLKSELLSNSRPSYKTIFELAKIYKKAKKIQIEKDKVTLITELNIQL